jgi:hypothetical protein
MSSLLVGLLYVAPFIGGVFGSSLAGKVSDLMCRFMTRRNGGVFEPEFRLLMVIPVAISTVIGNFHTTHPINNRIMGLRLVSTNSRPMDRSNSILRRDRIRVYPWLNSIDFLRSRFLPCGCRKFIDLLKPFQECHW